MRKRELKNYVFPMFEANARAELGFNFYKVQRSMYQKFRDLFKK